MRCTMLTKYEKIPFSKTFGTVIVERLFDFACYIGIILITFLIQIKTVSNFITEKMDALVPQKFSISPWVIAAVVIGVIAFIYLILKWGHKKLGHLGIVKKINQITTGMKEGFLTIIHLKKRKAFYCTYTHAKGRNGRYVGCKISRSSKSICLCSRGSINTVRQRRRRMGARRKKGGRVGDGDGKVVLRSRAERD